MARLILFLGLIPHGEYHGPGWHVIVTHHPEAVAVVWIRVKGQVEAVGVLSGSNGRLHEEWFWSASTSGGCGNWRWVAPGEFLAHGIKLRRQ